MSRLSAAAWLGSLPPDWGSARIRWLFRIINGGTPATADSSYWNGDIPWATPEDLGHCDGGVIGNTRRTLTEAGVARSSAEVVPPPSLLLSTRAPIGYVSLAGGPFTTNQGCRALVPISSDVDPKFYLYALVAARGLLRAEGQGSTFTELSSNDLGNVRLPFPPRSTQEAIASFLDRETARIDTLIEKKRRLLDLLEEKRTALITRAVTRGLDPDVPMKDSGIEWIGEIPQHWEIRQARYLCSLSRPIIYGIVLPGPDVPEGVPLIKGGDVERHELEHETLARTAFEIEERHTRSRVAPGDVVYSIRGSFGEAAVVPGNLNGANLTQDVARLSPRAGVDSEWLRAVLTSAALKAIAAAGALGATIKGVNIRDLRRLPIPTPPVREQQRLAEYVRKRNQELDRTEDRVRGAILLLQEYRTALISAAVTGKIDVTERALVPA